MPSRKPRSGMIAVGGTIALVALLAYIMGYRTAHVQVGSESASQAAITPIDVNVWIYPGARPESRFGDGPRLSSTSRVKELFPGGRYLGASQTVLYIRSPADLKGRTDWTPDALEKVCAYYARRLQLPPAHNTFQPGFVGSTMFASGTGQLTEMRTSPIGSEVKTALLTSTNDTGSLAVFLSRGRTDRQTTITLLGFNAPLQMKLFVSSIPRMLPGRGP